MTHSEPLSEASLSAGVAYLVRTDADLAGVVRRHGPPPLWERPPGFATLVHIILEQQVSLASARAAFQKLTSAVGVLTPSNFLRQSSQTLREFGFSRQKAAYCRGLAQSIKEGRLDLEGLQELSDEQVRSLLIQARGIGPWTADIYLLMALRRPDVWPSGDLALAAAVQQVKRLSARPNHDDLHEIAAPWKPWRAVAARILWHHYLS